MAAFISLYSREHWIPLSACKNGYAYYIHARNAKVGIFSILDDDADGFIISRHKFKSNFLFREYHWDTGEPYGTVKPLRELQEAPINMSDDQTLAWLNALSETIRADPWLNL